MVKFDHFFKPLEFEGVGRNGSSTSEAAEPTAWNFCAPWFFLKFQIFTELSSVMDKNQGLIPRFVQDWGVCPNKFEKNQQNFLESAKNRRNFAFVNKKEIHTIRHIDSFFIHGFS